MVRAPAKSCDDRLGNAAVSAATAPIAILGCVYLFFNLDQKSINLFLIWAAIGLVVYFLYSRRRSHVGLGHIEVHEDDSDAPPPPVPPAPSFN